MTKHFDINVPVLIAGAGPVGLVLALELEHHGIKAMAVERNQTTTSHPKMDVTNGRSMELFRRLGLADELRSCAVSSTHPLSVVWATKLAEWELARFDYPTVDEARENIRQCNDGTMPLEPNMRVSQVVLEPALRKIIERDGEHICLQFGWALKSFQQDADGVESIIVHQESGETKAVRSQYLVGCDGGSSTVRKGLDIALGDLPVREVLNQSGGLIKNVFSMLKAKFRGQAANDGRIYLIHFKSTDKDFFERFGTAWHIQTPYHGTVISQNDLDTWTIHIPLTAKMDVKTIDPRAFLFECLGQEIECEILVSNAWRPRLALADKYAKGRVFLAGDSAHQVIPTGGYGMNTGVGDAVDLGWKLAAVLNGWGGSKLLASYGEERRPVGERNRAASARHMSIRMLISQAYTPEVTQDSATGEAAREKFSSRIQTLGNLENEALGIEFDYCYSQSSIVCHDVGEPAEDDWASIMPGTRPGARPSSLFLENGAPIFDKFTTGFTLLRFGDIDVKPFSAAAEKISLPLVVVDIRDAHALDIYERELVLLRPDQHVAWRGNALPDNIEVVLDTVTGK